MAAALHEPADHAHEVLDPRWAALAGFASEDADEDGSMPDKLDQ